MATHSSTLTWRSPWTEEPGGLQSTGSQKQSDTTEQLRLSALFGTNRKPHNNVQLKNVTLFSSPAMAEAWVFPPSVSTGKLQGSGMHGGDLATAQTFWRPRRNKSGKAINSPHHGMGDLKPPYWVPVKIRCYSSVIHFLSSE